MRVHWINSEIRPSDLAEDARLSADPTEVNCQICQELMKQGGVLFQSAASTPK